MKKVILSLTMALVCLTASAQFEAGKKYVNASMSGFGMSYNKNAGFALNLSATGGYFLAQDWMLFGRLGYDHPGDNINSLELGAGGRYYIEQNGLSLGLGVSYEFSKAYGLKTNHGFLTPEIAYTFFLNRYVTLEPAVYYKMCFDDFADSSTVGLKLGIGIYF